MTLVFVSSVAVGLEPYCDAVHEAINCLDGYKSIRMEDFGAKNDAPLSVCLAKLYECEIFVGIVGHRYGSKGGIYFTQVTPTGCGRRLSRLRHT
jgi:hypothetical protein